MLHLETLGVPAPRVSLIGATTYSVASHQQTQHIVSVLYCTRLEGWIASDFYVAVSALDFVAQVTRARGIVSSQVSYLLLHLSRFI